MGVRFCNFCGGICFDGEPCPDCDKKHRDGQQRGAMGRGRRVPALTLDQQEGNAEEYFGGVNFPIMWR